MSPCRSVSAHWAALLDASSRPRSMPPFPDLPTTMGTPLDQDVRPRVRAGATISAKDYLAGLAERERMKLAFNAAIEPVGCAADPDDGCAGASGLPRSTRTRRRRGSRGGSISTTSVRRRFRTGFTEGGLPLSLQIVLPGVSGAVGTAYRLCLPGGARLAFAGTTDG